MPTSIHTYIHRRRKGRKKKQVGSRCFFGMWECINFSHMQQQMYKQRYIAYILGNEQCVHIYEYICLLPVCGLCVSLLHECTHTHTCTHTHNHTHTYVRTYICPHTPSHHDTCIYTYLCTISASSANNIYSSS